MPPAESKGGGSWSAYVVHSYPKEPIPGSVPNLLMQSQVNLKNKVFLIANQQFHNITRFRRVSKGKLNFS
jgi:hypothetical protein